MSNSASFFQVSRGELAGPLSNSEFYQFQVKVITTQQYFTQEHTAGGKLTTLPEMLKSNLTAGLKKNCVLLPSVFETFKSNYTQSNNLALPHT